MKTIVNKEVTCFDFVSFVYKRLEDKFYYGITRSEFRRKAGLLFSLNSDQSNQLLKLLEQRFPIRKLHGRYVLVEERQ